MPDPGHEHSEKFERCLEHLKAQGYDDGAAHRICYAAGLLGLVDEDGSIRGGVSEELQAESRRAGPEAYVCTDCGTEAPAGECLACKGSVPLNWCSTCGMRMGIDACPRCGQRFPAGNPTPNGGILMSVGKAPNVVEVRAFTLGDLSCRETELEGVVEAYVSAETMDSYKTIIDQDQVLAHILSARVDQEHDEQAIPGVRIVAAEKVKRQLDGKETDSTKVTVIFDKAVSAARAALDKIRDLTYRGFSIMFGISKELTAALKAGVTNTIDKIEALPFVSLVANPANADAIIDCYRSRQAAAAFDLSGFADLRRAVQALQAKANLEAAPPPLAADPLAELEARLVRTFEGRINALRDAVLGALNTDVIAAIADSRTQAEALVRTAEGRWAQQLERRIAQLRAAPPKLIRDPEAATVPPETSNPTAAHSTLLAASRPGRFKIDY